MKITRGVYWEALLEGSLLRCARLKPFGRESKRDHSLRGGLLPYLQGKGDPVFSFRDLDLSGYSGRVLKVFKALRERATFGTVITYGELGDFVGEHPRFVGYCMKINRFPLLIPCHRVVGARDTGGFSYGKVIKERLLAFEGSLIR